MIPFSSSQTSETSSLPNMPFMHRSRVYFFKRLRGHHFQIFPGRELEQSASDDFQVLQTWRFFSQRTIFISLSVRFDNQGSLKDSQATSETVEVTSETFEILQAKNFPARGESIRSCPREVLKGDYAWFIYCTYGLPGLDQSWTSINQLRQFPLCVFV